MTRDEALSTSVSLALRITQDGEVVSFDRSTFKKNLALAGFAIVPVVPTEKMILSGAKRKCAFKDADGYATASGSVGEGVAHSVYRTMIAAYEKEVGDD